jgi:hypothetical protein
VSIHQIINMVAVRDGLVSTAGSMLMTAPYFRSAAFGIGRIVSNEMLVYMIAVHVVQMAVMQVVEVAIVADRSVTAVRSMPVGVVRMMLLGASGHVGAPSILPIHPRSCLGVNMGSAEAVPSLTFFPGGAQNGTGTAPPLRA